MILSNLLLKNGNRVFGVEPNPEMRAAAEEILYHHLRFASVLGTAEATTHPDVSVDFPNRSSAARPHDATRRT